VKIIWENPPKPNVGRRSIIDMALPTLKKNPGRWAKLATYKHASSASSTARTWKKRFAATNSLEIVSRGGSIYVRYNGPSEVLDSHLSAEELISVL